MNFYPYCLHLLSDLCEIWYVRLAHDDIAQRGPYFFVGTNKITFTYVL